MRRLDARRPSPRNNCETRASMRGAIAPVQTESAYHVTMSTRRQFLVGLLVAGGATVLPGCGGAPPSTRKGAERPAFYWGVGIENTWMVQADPAKDGSRRPLDELALTGHYQRWREDFALAHDLGVNAIRYGLPWHRAEPSPGVYDWSLLDRALTVLVEELGIVPILDLLHYGTPAWMGDGIGDPRFVDSFATYASKLARHVGGLATHFTPVNEPVVVAAMCGNSGVWPPYQSSRASWAALGVRVARAMVLATGELRAANPDAFIVSADPINWLLADKLFPAPHLGAETLEELCAAAGSFPACLAYGRLQTGNVLADYLVQQGVARSDLEWFAAHAALPDVVGYNHYPDIVDFPNGPDFTRGGSLPLGEAALAATKQVEQGLRRAQAYFGLPIYLTETSAGLTGEARAAYATAIGDMVARLRADGVPLVGVNWWPLFEAVQWGYREAPDQPLSDFIKPGGWNNGLHDLDASLRRVETPAAAAFAAVIARG